MSAWTYIKRVTLDQTGGVEPIGVGLERNPDAVLELGAHNPPDLPLYVLRVGISGGFGGTQAGLPVYRRDNPAPHPILKEIYHCEVAGKRLEAANIYALREKVQRQLETIAPGRSLPLCYFRAPRFDYSLAVHEDGPHLVCPVLTGPKIKADSLAELREPVVRHLHTAGYLLVDEAPEVLVVRPSDLRQVPPAAVIRSLDDPRVWMPTVEGVSAEGAVIGLLVHPTELGSEQRRRRDASEQDAPPSAPELSALLRYIGNEMRVRGALHDPWALHATDVRPEIWARTEELTEPTSACLTAHLEGGGELQVPVHRTAAGESVGAIRTDRISVFLAGDDDALAACIGRYLVGAGYLRDPRDLRPEAVRTSPAETLDPDSIWTGPPQETRDPRHQTLPEETTPSHQEVQPT